MPRLKRWETAAETAPTPGAALRTEICILIDRSGSMQQNRDAHQEGIKQFVKEQGELEGEVRFTLVQFDSQAPFEVVYEQLLPDAVPDYQLQPRGMTPLYDAIGKTVQHIRGLIEPLQPKPQTILVIVTDGLENASTEWTKQAVQELLAECEQQDWSVVYLAANVDAFQTGAAMGMAAQQTSGYLNTPLGTHSVYSSVSANVKRSRSAYLSGASLKKAKEELTFTEEQRDAAMEQPPQK